MLPCHSCYICETWRSKEEKGLKSSYGGKKKSRKKGKLDGGTKEIPMKLNPRLVYLNYLPISASFGVKSYMYYFNHSY